MDDLLISDYLSAAGPPDKKNCKKERGAAGKIPPRPGY
jgi:hypothetical protein